jgi:PDZ domain-containing protein
VNLFTLRDQTLNKRSLENFLEKPCNAGHTVIPKEKSMKAILGIAVLMLAGCASNGYTKFYTPRPNSAELLASPNNDKAPAEPKVLTVSQQNAKTTFDDLRRHGYIMFAESSFYGPASKTTNDQAIEQAQKVGAALVTIGISYHDTLSGTNSFTLPGAPVTSTVSTNGSVGGYYYNANSTVTTPGAPQQYNIPYSVDRNDFWAGYWVHQSINSYKFGGQLADLPPDVRSRLHRNTGVWVPVVVVGTPAFLANVMDGDVITKINGMDVTDQASFREQLVQFSGQPVTFELLRGEEKLSVKMTLH